MRKWIGGLVAIAIIAAPNSAMAAVKAGDTCKKAGQTATSSGKKFTCIKSGKKLVWNKGVTIAAPKPLPTPTPTPIPRVTATPNPTSTSTPVIEKSPTGFNDLVENFKGVYVGVWQSTESKISANPAVDVKQNILVGPNSLLLNSSVDKAFSRGTQFFAGYPQPKRFNALYYGTG